MLTTEFPDEAFRRRRRRKQTDQRDNIRSSSRRCSKIIASISQNKHVENEVASNHVGVALKDDPEYAKYFHLLEIGLPKSMVKYELQRDGKDPSILDLDPNEPVVATPPSGKKKMSSPVERNETAAVELKKDTKADQKQSNKEEKKNMFVVPTEDPEFHKIVDTLKNSLPPRTPKHTFQQDKREKQKPLSPRSAKEELRQIIEKKGSDSDISVKDDPQLTKHFSLLQVGAPVKAVTIPADGNSLSRVSLDTDKQVPQDSKRKKVDLSTEKDSVGVDADPSKLDQESAGSISSISTNEEDVVPDKSESIAPIYDPVFSKYANMLKIGVPPEAVKHALLRDGKDPSVLNRLSSKPLSANIDSTTSAMTDKEKKVNGRVSPKDDPEFSKYFNMLKIGLPVGAVKNALQRDGKDPSILDQDQEKPPLAKPVKDKPRVPVNDGRNRNRRKRLYWTPIDPKRIHKRTIWALCKGTFSMETLTYDEQKFEKLFVESASPVERRNSGSSEQSQTIKRKSGDKFIDSKKGLNGGILLSHLSIEYSKLANMIDTMDYGNLNPMQLRSLKNILPSYDERKALVEYINVNQDSNEASDAALCDLSECEKFMVAMLNVTKPAAKIECMLFRDTVYYRLDELVVSFNIVRKACIEVRSSLKLRKIMAMILTIVNHINTGGQGSFVTGFSLDTLVKLNQSKAFDKKTSILQYLVLILRENDKSLLLFKEEISSVPEAATIMLDGLSTDLKTLRDELYEAKKFAKDEADRYEEENEGVESDDVNGRTPMESFIMRAATAVKRADDTFDELKRKYGKVLEYFGEDETMPSTEFFGTLHKFVIDFDAALEATKKEEPRRAFSGKTEIQT